MRKAFFSVLAVFVLSLSARAQEPDPNFHIYLCFG